MPGIILFLLLASTYLMVTAKRMPALIRSFCYQSIFLFLATLLAAFHEKQIQLYLVAGMIVLLKVFLIPYFLNFTAKKIKVDENLGLFVNPQLSLVFALIFTYLLVLLDQIGQGSAACGSDVAFSNSYRFPDDITKRLRAARYPGYGK